MPREEGFSVELQQVMKVAATKETGEPSARDAPRPVEICGSAATNESEQTAPQSGDAGDWLVTLTGCSYKRLVDNQSRRKPRIQKVPQLLRHVTTNMPFFIPEVVSLGPYHYRREEFAAMEEHKKAAAAAYVGEHPLPMSLFYDKIKGVAGEARESYADKFENLSDDDFVNLMFFDGCFILHFIDCYMKRNVVCSPAISSHMRGYITRDIFLLENQIPFVVLKALMALRPVNYEGFVRKIAGQHSSAPAKSDKRAVEEDPIHLLDLLRIRMLGEKRQKVVGPAGANWQSFRSVVELKETGIKFRSSESRCLRDIQFDKWLLRGQLQLPPIVVDDLTKPRLLNLVALEMCSDSISDYGVSSYVCFMDNLIDHADDVKELRQREILLNCLGSDQQVADIFNEVAIGLSPDPDAYRTAVAGINNHYKNKRKVSFVTMLNTHFSSPWTCISFMAAVLLIILTLLQTFFTICPKYAVQNKG